MPAPNCPCAVAVRYGLSANSVLGRPLLGLTTHWIQSEAFSDCAQDPCTYQLALSPRSRLKRAKTSFASSSERNVPYLMKLPSPPDSMPPLALGTPCTIGIRTPFSSKVKLLKPQAVPHCTLPAGPL